MKIEKYKTIKIIIGIVIMLRLKINSLLINLNVVSEKIIKNNPERKIKLLYFV